MSVRSKSGSGHSKTTRTLGHDSTLTEVAVSTIGGAIHSGRAQGKRSGKWRGGLLNMLRGVLRSSKHTAPL